MQWGRLYLPVVALFLVVCLGAGDDLGQAWRLLHKGHKERVVLSGETFSRLPEVWRDAGEVPEKVPALVAVRNADTVLLVRGNELWLEREQNGRMVSVKVNAVQSHTGGRMTISTRTAGTRV